MAEIAVVETLSAAAADVLETMFFTTVLEEAEPADPPPDGALAARMLFSGGRSGAFAVRISAGAAECIAANFLADETEQPTPGQIRDVVGELTNMICGSVLSRLDREAHFDLGHPDMVDPGALAMPGAAARAFDIGEGEVAVFLHLDVQP